MGKLDCPKGQVTAPTRLGSVGQVVQALGQPA